MENLNTIEDKAEELLVNTPKSRDMSNMEFLELYWQKYDNARLPYLFKHFTDAESVTRAMRKIKEKRPELKENKEVEQAKLFKEEIFYKHYKR